MADKEIVVTVRSVPERVTRAIDKKARAMGVSRAAYVRMMLIDKAAELQNI